MTNIVAEAECEEYVGHNFKLGELKVKFRKAKVTPKKVGQFVTLWRRDAHKQTAPFDIDDDFDFYIILTAEDDNYGFFFFSKNILCEQGILSSGVKVGKRGFRVYPDWDTPINKQSEKTKSWQRNYFIDLTDGDDKGMMKLNSLAKKKAPVIVK